MILAKQEVCLIRRSKGHVSNAFGKSGLFNTQREAAGGQNSTALTWVQKNSKPWGPERTVLLSKGSNLFR